MQQTRRSRVRSALAAAALFAAASAVLLPSAGAFASEAEAADVARPASNTPALPPEPESEPESLCAGVELRVAGEARVGATLAAGWGLTENLPQLLRSAPAVFGTDEPFVGAAVTFEWLSEPAPAGTADAEAAPPVVRDPALATIEPTPPAPARPEPTTGEAAAPDAPDAGQGPAATGPEYRVPASEIGRVIRVRATVTSELGAPLGCLSAPSGVVLDALPAEPGVVVPPVALVPAAPAEPAPLAAVQPEQRERGSAVGGAGAAEVEVVAAPPAAARHVFSIDISSDVLLIGGVAALALMTGAAVFSRGGD